VTERPPARLVLTTRGDALTGPLSVALGERHPVVAELDVDLTTAQRLLVAGATVRPSRRAWAERYFKSGLAVALRTRNAGARLRDVDEPYDLVFQVHALFEIPAAPYVMYVDCTHRQSAEQWPEWNPLRGRALRRWYARERRQYAAARHIFTFATETRDDLVDAYGVAPEKVSVVGAGVNFASLPAPRPARPLGSPTVLFIGNDFIRKGGEVLLQAFALVRRAVPDARLQIVGTRHPVGQQAGVEVLGRIEDRARIAELYRTATVFCLPTFFDPYALVLLEAMAFGLPVVATPSCGIPEVVVDGETGVLVAAGDHERLAAVLVRLLEDHDEAARMGSAGRRRVELEMLWSHVVERMGPVLDDLAAGAGG